MHATGGKASSCGGAAGRSLNVVLLGGLDFSVDGAPLRVVSRKARALLAYLALSDSGRETRERLVGLLWSEASEENARGSLRQIVHELRGAFRNARFEGFTADKLLVCLDPAHVRVDIAEIAAAAAAGLPHKRLVEIPLLHEKLLHDCELVDPAFRMWLVARRQTLQDRLLRGLEKGLRGSTSPELKEAVADCLLHLDPTHEEACRCLIAARAGRSDFGGALRLYKALWDLLGSEFDVEPSQETQNLVIRIRTALSAAEEAVQVAAAPASGMPVNGHAPNTKPLPRSPMPHAAAPSPNLVIAVGDFDASGTRPEQRYMVAGFRHELVASLIRFREWRVRDGLRTADSSATRDNASAEYRIEASAYSGGGAPRLVLTLGEAGSGLFVWSETIDLTLEGWFEAQRSIIRRVAAALNVHISANRLHRVSQEKDVALDVHDRWLRAQPLILNFDPQGWLRAAEIFRASIAAAPTFSRAYSSLVQINNTMHIVHPGVFRTPDRAAEALRLARAAIELDPVDSRAQLSMGWAQAMTRAFVQAEIHMDLAVELNENDSWTQLSAALFQAFAGRPERARDLAGKALEIAPPPTQAHWVYHSTVAFMTGAYERCVEASRQAGDAIWSNLAWRAAALAELGREAEAAVELQRFFSGLRAQWVASPEPDEPTMTRWLLHLYPIRDEANWERLRGALGRAGARVAAHRHGSW